MAAEPIYGLSRRDAAVIKQVVAKVQGGRGNANNGRRGRQVRNPTRPPIVSGLVDDFGEGWVLLRSLRVYGAGAPPYAPLLVKNTTGNTVSMNQAVTAGRLKQPLEVNIADIGEEPEIRLAKWELLPVATADAPVRFRLTIARPTFGGHETLPDSFVAETIDIFGEAIGEVTIKDPGGHVRGKVASTGYAVKTSAGFYQAVSGVRDAYDVWFQISEPFSYQSEDGGNEFMEIMGVTQARCIYSQGPMFEDYLAEEAFDPDDEDLTEYTIYDPNYLASGLGPGDCVRCRRVFYGGPDALENPSPQYEVTEVQSPIVIVQIAPTAGYEESEGDQDVGDPAQADGALYTANVVQWQRNSIHQNSSWESVPLLVKVYVFGTSPSGDNPANLKIGDRYAAVRVGRLDPPEDILRGDAVYVLLKGGSGEAFTCLITASLAACTLNAETGVKTPYTVPARLYNGNTPGEEIEIIWEGQAKSIPAGKAVIGKGMLTDRGYEVFTIWCDPETYNPPA